MIIMTIDPGDHIGTLVVELDSDGNTLLTLGRTIEGDNRNCELWKYMHDMKPDKIIYERFALRAGAAQKLVGNTFITCEVIGVIKLFSQLYDIGKDNSIELLPSCKEYCGFSSSPKDPRYKDIYMYKNEKITEHVRDTYRLYSYYKLFGNKINK